MEQVKQDAFDNARLEVIKDGYDRAFECINEALTADEAGDKTRALDLYKRGLQHLLRAISVPSRGEECIGSSWESVRQMQQKMQETLNNITTRLARLETSVEVGATSAGGVSHPSAPDMSAESLNPTKAMLERPVPPNLLSPSGQPAGAVGGSTKGPSTTRHPLGLAEQPPVYSPQAADGHLSISYGTNTGEMPPVGNEFFSHTSNSTPSPQSLSEDGEELLSFPHGVQVFFVTPEGQVSAPSYPGYLRLVRFTSDHSDRMPNRPPAFLQVCDWLYPLMKTFPVLLCNTGVFMFPDMMAPAPGYYLGVVLSAELPAADRRLFQDLLTQMTDFRVQAPDEAAESINLSQSVSVATPKETVPEETVPEETVPEETVPEETVSEETVPEETVPEETVPEETVPEETVPEETVPEETVPEETVPEETVPEETVPEETVPEETVPEETVPEETVPEETVPEETVPEETVPEETVPEETVPEETVPEETVPEETVPEETVPEETVPEETVPEETVPEEAVPEETEEENNLPEWSEKVASGILTGASWLKWGLVKGAEYTGVAIHKGASKLREHITPEDKPTHVSPTVTKSLHVAQQATGGAVKVRQFLVDRVCAIAGHVGKELAPHVKKHGGKLIPELLKDKDGCSNMGGAMVVAASGVEGFAAVWTGLKVAAKNITTSVAAETVATVKHKYGAAAGQATDHAVNAAINVGTIASNLDNLDFEAVLKRAGKQTAKGLLKDNKIQEKPGKQVEKSDK